ncbi:type I-C CRISPR-associated protein Cas8c/Csd1 [Paenibacillus yanchengensis]|uniref:Type I-C CRISPR-associated protein Cas8c/Csd1 n=1 Tax=Paenibacillus yanchengensis TaxID=2035833 RepID=A0ABW4YJG8_9BACL
MSWLLQLYETYEANQAAIGKVEKKFNGQEYALLPIGHTTQNAHIEVQITEDGNFHSATVLTKQEMSTLIPTTEDSASRSGSANYPYPLHDKLSYVAGDYGQFGRNNKKLEHHTKYIEQLRLWASSPHGINKVKSMYHYLQKGQLIADLVAHDILYVNDDGRLITKWEKRHESLASIRPAIFSIVAGDQEDAFVRFNVYSPTEHLTEVWNDKQMYDSYIGFYSDQLSEQDICYVTGNTQPGTVKHANKIRHAADKAKLISANDSSGFTYRGRFDIANEAASIGYDVSQKAHNALKWLINRQAKVVDERVFLVWGNEQLDLPDMMDDFFSLDPTAVLEEGVAVHTYEELAQEVAKAMSGYRNSLSAMQQRLEHTPINIMVLDSATTGRMAVIYYRNMDKELYLQRLEQWHTTCTWLHRYRKNEQGEFVRFFGAPATKDIAFAAYGPRADDKLVKGLMERMLTCMIDSSQQTIPRDIVQSAVQRASNPVAMERWEWEKTLSIACALVNKQEGMNVALDKENVDRNYLFGRLLAVADVLERNALGGEQRATNAIRYMNAFVRHPARTWSTIQQSLQPYQARLGTKATYWNKIIDEIGAKMPVEQFNNQPLTSLYLLGFYSQRHELYQGGAKAAAAIEEETEI